MQPKTNRLLMLLVGIAIAGCAGQTERSSSGGGEQARSAPAAAPAPAPEPEKVPPKAVAAAPKDEALPDFPVNKYELPEEQAKDEEVEDLGPQDDDSVSTEQDAMPAEESSVGEATEYADDQDAADSDEVEDLGPQDDDSMSAEQDAAPAEESSVGETTEYADDQEAADSSEVEDLGPQPDESGTVTYPEEKRADAGNVVGEPKVYQDEKPVAAPQKSVAAPPKPVSLSFETEPLFNFDKAEVRADQRAKLDEFMSGLSGAQYDSIAVIGHTDRIGKDAYNQKLSERRANAVKAYLVRKGVPADKIQAEGHGKAESVTGDACANARGKVLISCLQPDRRVDVSVSATKQSN